MKLDQFIFSNQPKYRICRHIALWIAFSAYFFVVNFFPKSEEELLSSKTFLDAFHKMIYIPISIFSVYISIYILVPRLLLAEKYLYFLMSFFVLSIFNIGIAYLITKLLVQITHQIPQEAYIYQSLIYGLGMGAAASGFASIIKMYKVHYLERRENEILQQQIINTELQMIKSNFHPHFLSNALSNIAEFIRNNSKETPAIILKLSDLLSYILYENQEDRVSMEQEMLMVKEYLDLERIFYGNRIVIDIQEEGDLCGKAIAPLILLTLVQNCCEQFLISLQQKLNIDISAISGANQFIFQLSCNGYYENIHGPADQNTRFRQAIRRIQLTYTNQHKMEIHSENGLFQITIILEQAALIETSVEKSEEISLYELA